MSVFCRRIVEDTKSEDNFGFGEVTHLGRDAVYGGGIFLDPSGPNKRFTLRYAFNAPGTRYQKIGTLVEKASPTTAVVYVAAQ